MAKDRARPFSRKHRKYWIPVTGGMIVIGAINVGLGMCTYDPPSEPPKRIELDLKPKPYEPPASLSRPSPGGPDSGSGSGSATGSGSGAR